MSIITQALKKAQHEQRVQQPRRARYGSLASVRLNEPRRRPSRLVAVGGVLLLGAGIAAYLWPSMRGAAPIAMTVPSNPPAAPDIQIALPPSAPVSNPQARSPQTPDPWVLKLLQPGAQPRTTPPPINTANLETPRTVPPPAGPTGTAAPYAATQPTGRRHPGSVAEGTARPCPTTL